MDMKLEVIELPVSDVDRAKQFYQKLGFRLDVDYTENDTYRAVHLTPPGSEASIIFGKGVTCARLGSIGRLLVAVADIDATRRELISLGVDVSDVFHDAGGGLGGGFHATLESRATGPDPAGRSYGSYATFKDPDGNEWLLQQVTERLPGRVSAESVNGRATEMLLNALKNASTAHGEHEKELGRHDADWPQWYAEHMTRSLAAAGYHLTGPPG